jgi:hypothetical protein
MLVIQSSATLCTFFEDDGFEWRSGHQGGGSPDPIGTEILAAGLIRRAEEYHHHVWRRILAAIARTIPAEFLTLSPRLRVSSETRTKTPVGVFLQKYSGLSH